MPTRLTLAPTGLPIEDVVGALRAALAAPSNAVLVAEPGAGKTTVVPLRLADEAWLAGSRMVVLQPRRVVARASARRMATMLGEEVGATVGYRTGEDRRVGSTTRIEVVTEGIMTRRVQSDPELAGIGMVVFDEFHERHLDSDLGLALCLDVQRSLRPDLRLLVMSATIDAAGVAAVLAGPGTPAAPVITSRGRLHPVQIRWQPPAAATPVVDTVARVVRSALVDHPIGDLLAFLPGVAEITRVGHALSREAGDAVEIRPLHGSLPASKQDRALAPARPGHRKVVLCTDLAETSLTVEGVALVVDAGLARSPRFDPATGLTRLHTGPASAASADQRAGRAGRTGPGVAYRLWAQGEHRARRPWPDPEITTVDLTGLALELAVWGANPATLAWLDLPPPAALARAQALLADLGAVRPDRAVTAGDRSPRPGDPPSLPAVTPLGRRMVRLGAHPRLAAIVAAAPDADRWLACVLAALVDEPGTGSRLR
ncbi:MAG: DEAD/DEAH box helicase, partial [Actinomycetota bacterium]|nr:DEAD/DEAH box helicase [Actinomycetota bacterium]